MQRLPAIVLCTRHSIGSVSQLYLCPNRRVNSTNTAVDLGARLQANLKAALKAKDSFTATTIRSVLSEVYAAQKQAAPAALGHSDVVSIVRKAGLRRLDAMKQFENASRPDLAQNERKEAELLATYLPPKLSIDGVDRILQEIIAQIPERDKNPTKAKGLCLKTFYSQIDKNAVDGDMVRRRIEELWSS